MFSSLRKKFVCSFSKCKYLFNDFPYIGKDDTRSSAMSVPTDLVLKLMAPLFQRDYNVTW